MKRPIPSGALVVSCQARGDNPLHGPVFMGAMALAARDGGAQALRLNGPADVAAAVPAGLPIIGIDKIETPGFSVYITPTFAAARALVAAGADIVALDCTFRPRAGEPPAELIRRIRGELGAFAFADCATLEEGVAAAEAGADYVGTTLSGYTVPGQPPPGEPDLALVAALAARISTPVIAEGRYNTPALARAAIAAGAHAVVVGTMITNPREITKAFARQVAGR